jgi:AbrB family looped-hinge helix DNA binding protein
MKTVIASVTQRGQVTIPAEVRRRLGLGATSKVAFEIDDHEVRMVPAPFTLESAFGSVQPSHRPQDFETICREAKEAHVERTITKQHER